MERHLCETLHLEQKSYNNISNQLLLVLMILLSAFPTYIYIYKYVLYNFDYAQYFGEYIAMKMTIGIFKFTLHLF